jgi:hypothetical protein
MYLNHLLVATLGKQQTGQRDYQHVKEESKMGPSGVYLATVWMVSLDRCHVHNICTTRLISLSL